MLVRCQALLCMLKVATSLFSKKPKFVAVIKGGEGKVPKEG